MFSAQSAVSMSKPGIGGMGVPSPSVCTSTNQYARNRKAQQVCGSAVTFGTASVWAFLLHAMGMQRVIPFSPLRTCRFRSSHPLYVLQGAKWLARRSQYHCGSAITTARANSLTNVGFIRKAERGIVEMHKASDL